MSLEQQCPFERVSDINDFGTKRCQHKTGHKGNHRDFHGIERGVWARDVQWQEQTK